MLKPNSTDNGVNKYKAFRNKCNRLKFMLCLPIIMKNTMPTKIM